MRRLLPLKVLVAVMLAACVTVNVYFPAAAAERAADQLIDRVTNPQPQGSTPNGEPQGSIIAPASSDFAPGGEENTRPVLLAALGHVLEALVPAAHAQAAANLDIDTPEIRAITASMRTRYGQLKPYIDSGAVGLTANGLLELRDANAVPLAERAKVKSLVAEENRDRQTLYAEIAKANGHPEWKADIQSTFGRRWIERAAAGTYYQDAGGNWKQK
ncbi:MAG: YdbL family protein [Steroidobacteraceae bacterium]|nr:YdbL family protein [Steroidobacteraceae bacterium]